VQGPVGKTHGRRQIKITLKGLAPETTYQYQLCGKGDGVKVYRCVGPNGKTSSSSHFATTGCYGGLPRWGISSATTIHPTAHHGTWTRSAGSNRYTDADIAGGSQDGYITQWARAARWGHPFLIRFDWEMNGNWWPWNGHWENSPADFVAMWRHVHDIFVANGATNATWVWSPNVPWVDFSRLVSSTYSAIQVAPDKPMMVGEVGSVENAENDDAKANWINSLFVELPNDFPAIRGLLWYENPGDDGEDWPIESSRRSIGAFASGITNLACQASVFTNLDTTTVQAP
jgi:hypothetical protein